MTEREWLECTDPQKILWYLKGKVRNSGELELLHYKAFARKLRLFTVACCRRPYYQSEDRRFQQAIDLNEQVAEGRCAEDAWHSLYCLNEYRDSEFVRARAWRPLIQDRWKGAFEGAYSVTDVDWEEVEAKYADEPIHQVALLRHIFGNPFRSYLAPDHWPSPVTQLANALYNGEDCGFALHDKLLEAGHPELADHFRQEQSHPKGCWVVDLLLGKA